MSTRKARCPTCGALVELDDLPPCPGCQTPRRDWPEGRDPVAYATCSPKCGTRVRMWRFRQRRQAWPKRNEPIVVNGQKYRVRGFGAGNSILLSRSPGRKPYWYIRPPGGSLSYDKVADVWRAPDGLPVKKRPAPDGPPRRAE